MAQIENSLKEFFEILKDRKWHDLYEFHQAYRLQPFEIFDVVNYLLRNNLIVKAGRKIKLDENLTNSKMALLNRIQKTKRPNILDFYAPTRLTSRRHYV